MTTSHDYIWQDRDIRFDSKPNFLQLRSNEVRIDDINSVEDTKGNNGERGSMIITNLRMIWVAHASSKVNLSKIFFFFQYICRNLYLYLILFCFCRHWL